jgi:hypothetical protein
MPRPSRIRRIAKWGGVLVCVVIAAVFLSSAHRPIGGLTESCLYGAGVSGGVAWFAWTRPREEIEEAYEALSSTASQPVFSSPGPFYLPELMIPFSPRSWWNGGPLGRLGSTWRTRYVTVPLPSLFVLFAIPTAYLFWRDRRRFPPGHCRRCGYDLTSNVTGRCPECGEEV